MTLQTESHVETKSQTCAKSGFQNGKWEGLTKVDIAIRICDVLEQAFLHKVRHVPENDPFPLHLFFTAQSPQNCICCSQRKQRHFRKRCCEAFYAQRNYGKMLCFDCAGGAHERCK